MTSAHSGLPSPPASAAAESPEKPNNISLGCEVPTQQPMPALEDPKKAGTGPYLEALSHQILDVSLNMKDHSHPLLVKHMSPAFRGKHDALPKVNNRDDHQNNLKKHLDKQPELHVTILNSSSDVDDSRGRATVYIWYSLGGLEHGLEREAVAVLSWERKQGVWMIIKHSGMRGPSGFS
jgi:hypothetical protein